MITTMAENKIKQQETELNDEQLDEVAGGRKTHPLHHNPKGGGWFKPLP